MKKHIIVLILFSFLSMTVPAFADFFYWASEYKAVYDDKIAIELKHDLLKKEYSAEKINFEAKIREQNDAIRALNDKFDAQMKRNIEEQKVSSDRMKNVEVQNVILKNKSSTREKELLDENRKINDRLSGELKKLRENLAQEQESAREKYNALKIASDKKSDEMLARINEQNELIVDLKKLSETQKKELNRLSQQAGEIEKQLGDEIKKGQIRLKRFQDRIIINLDDAISFDSGSSKLKPDIKKALDKLNLVLVNYPENRIYIEGNTDNIPIHTAVFRGNWQLSTERALSVLEYLLENIKLNPTRLSAVGNGEFNPLLPNDTLENRALNRRVDIIIFPSVTMK